MKWRWTKAAELEFSVLSSPSHPLSQSLTQWWAVNQNSLYLPVPMNLSQEFLLYYLWALEFNWGACPWDQAKGGPQNLCSHSLWSREDCPGLGSSSEVQMGNRACSACCPWALAGGLQTTCEVCSRESCRRTIAQYSYLPSLFLFFHPLFYLNNLVEFRSSFLIFAGTSCGPLVLVSTFPRSPSNSASCVLS